MSDFLRIDDNTFINGNAIEAITLSRTLAVIYMGSGKIFRLEGATNVSATSELFLTGVADDPMTPETPRGLFAGLLGYFRR